MAVHKHAYTISTCYVRNAKAFMYVGYMYYTLSSTYLRLGRSVSLGEGGGINV